MPLLLPPPPTPTPPCASRDPLHAAPRRSRSPSTSRPPSRHRRTASARSTLPAAVRDLLADDPMPRAFSALLKAASSASPPRRPSSLGLGAQLHAQAVVRGFLGGDDSTILATAVLSFYASCREPDLARKVFDGMPRRNAIYHLVLKFLETISCTDVAGNSGSGKKRLYDSSVPCIFVPGGNLKELSGQYNVIVHIAAHSFGENQNKYLEERIIGCDAQLLYTSNQFPYSDM
uniref:Pentatricopeptide repeat-containing protein n=1 Tax=Oryza meridionalis TaxID=40149 RepID=A0A0E0D372_9ORYZ